MDASRTSLIAALLRYRDRWPGESAAADAFVELVQREPAAFVRDNLARHFTGSAWLVSADGRRVLLMHHRKLERWLQPGGRADGDSDLARVALREAAEETGVTRLQLLPEIFDIDRHAIPARGLEPAHWHHDVRYVVCAGEDESFVVNGESRALAWREVSEVAADASLERSLRRMASKWLARVV